jgi:HSP20 family protein
VARRDIDKLQELLADLWQVPRFSGGRTGFSPNVDCYHTDDPHELTVVIELPGVDPQSITIVVGERTLAVTGERTRPKAEGRVYQQMEVEYGPFRRVVRLTEDVDPEQAKATFERGMVTVTLPVTEGVSQSTGRIVIEVERL